MSDENRPEEVFPERLKIAREQIRRMSQKELAQKVGLPQSSIAHFESGSRKPSFDNLRKLANALDVTTDYLLGRAEQPTLADAGDPLFRDVGKLTDYDREMARNFLRMLAERDKERKEEEAAMNLAFRMKMAKQKAEAFLRDNGYTTLPIDPFDIAKKSEIDVKELTDGPDGVSGMLLRHGNSFGILYSTRINNEGFQRFSLSHELAHYFLEGHPEHVLKAGKHESRAGFTSADPYELEADSFASGLLMPAALFKKELNRGDVDLARIETMAGVCKTSLTATAIRSAELSDTAVAVVISTGQTIDYCFMSEAMKSLRNLTWLKKGTPVPRRTETARLNADPNRVLAGDRAAAEIDVLDWLGGTRSAMVTEEVVGLGRYGKTLTVLSSPTIGQEQSGYDDDDDDEERLKESWTPRFHKKR